MNQEHEWDNEYKQKLLLSPSTVPQTDVVRFSRWLKKEYKKAGTPLDMEEVTVLDLGSGSGRNSLYFAGQGATVFGYEIADTAIALAKKTARHAELPMTFLKHDIGTVYPIRASTVDIVLDVTSTNSLTDAARKIYLQEVHRILKPGGFLFVRALSTEGDQHAKRLVVDFPGPDPDTYVHPDIRIVEKVFSRESFVATYAPFFTIHLLDRTSHYPLVAGRRYKRQYWIAYLERKELVENLKD
jgi:SAM-dependent methyltransferase